MITTAELHRTAAKEGLRFDQAEKDYVLLWVLSSIIKVLDDNSRWVFKGGTCLRHCYYTGYRFSEDIDFTCRPEDEDDLAGVEILKKAGQIVETETGLEIVIKPERRSSSQKQIEIPIQYSRGGPRRQGLPAIAVHLTFDEPVLAPFEVRQVKPPYSDLTPFLVSAYNKIEIVAEKLRALLQQQEKWPRPRDLYDLWFILCYKAEKLQKRELREFFVRKCEVKNIDPNPRHLISEHLREWNRAAWKNQLMPTMRIVPDYEHVWSEWVQIFSEFL